MITDVVIRGLFDNIFDNYLNQSYITPYIVNIDGTRFWYSSDLMFDDKIREKIVKRDHTQPIWLTVLYNRDTIKSSIHNGRRTSALNLTTSMLGDGDDNKVVLGSCNMNLSFISNSITLLEHVEEVFLVRDMRRKFTVNYTDVYDDPTSAKFEGLEEVVVSVTDFQSGSLMKEPKELGPIATFSCSVVVDYPIIIPSGTFKPIRTVGFSFDVI